MPKKISTNPKAEEARARKTEKKNQEKAKVEKAKEDAYWQDDDPKLAKKKQQKEDEERKRLELAKKKAEAKALLEKEEKDVSATVKAKIPMAKVTRAQIDAEVEKRNKAIENANAPQKPKPPKPIPVEENLSQLNRAMFDMHVATNIDEAISVLSSKDDKEDTHPEKRLKAAYKAYEDANLPILKAENPSLKLSQLKQIIFKNWQKAPENPMNNQ